ncbi:hypothetical protein F4819DRAFT_474574 [Hypoxylon fuscum]|nr:hypothetical protein F4819DRAFT_474574 [Hypoxylon fuscum]
MGGRRSNQSQNIAWLLVVAVVFVLLRYTYTGNPSTPDPIAAAMSDASSDVIAKLQVSVRQVSSSPPTLAIAVTNAHAGPVTILRWDSPLDPLALQLGVVSLARGGSDGGPVDIPTVQVRRMMPPGPDALVTVAAGQTREQLLELREPMVPLRALRGTSVRVACRGEWTGVWPREADAVSAEALGKAGASEDAQKGRFESEAVEIEL